MEETDIKTEEIAENVPEENAESTYSKEKREKNFAALKSFLKTDLSVKEALLISAPSPEDCFNEESKIEYTDKLDNLLKDFKVELGLVSDNFEFGEVVKCAINAFVEKARKNLAIGIYDTESIKKIYQQNFSNMDPKFIEEVKDRCVGYTSPSPELLAELMGKATTVNEMLHVMHSYIMNNDQIISMMPKVSEKKNSFGYPITLYGEPSEIATKIFENFPHELDVGWTDIVSMQNKIFMMIRDRGHALTIDMDTSKENEIDVKYFIPKLCNEQMIRSLKGIDISSITKNGARGIFTATREEITDQLFGFIEKVPTDSDIPAHPFYYPDFEETIQPDEIDVVTPTFPDPEPPVFSIEQAKELATEPERRFGRIKEIVSKIVNLFSPLINKFKSDKTQDSKEDNESR